MYYHVMYCSKDTEIPLFSDHEKIVKIDEKHIEKDIRKGKAI